MRGLRRLLRGDERDPLVREVIVVRVRGLRLEPGVDFGGAVLAGPRLEQHACGKSNDTPQFPTRAVAMDPAGGYSLEDDFDVKEYLKEVDGRNSVKVRVADLVALVEAGLTHSNAIAAHFVEREQASHNTILRLLTQAVKQGRLTRKREGKVDVYAVVGEGAGDEEGGAGG